MIGQEVTDTTRQEIAKALKSFEPPVHINVQYIPTQDTKSVVVLEVY